MIVTLVSGEKRQLDVGDNAAGLMLASIEYTYEDTLQPAFAEYLQTLSIRLMPRKFIEARQDS